MNKNKKFKLTKQREQIYLLLKNSSYPLTTTEIFDLLQEDDEKIMALSTVYRVLQAMEDHQLVEKIFLPDSTPIAAYYIKESSHLHFAICLTCKKRFILPHCPMESIEKNVYDTIHFTVESHELTLYGYCEACKNN